MIYRSIIFGNMKLIFYIICMFRKKLYYFWLWYLNLILKFIWFNKLIVIWEGKKVYVVYKWKYFLFIIIISVLINVEKFCLNLILCII